MLIYLHNEMSCIMKSKPFKNTAKKWCLCFCDGARVSTIGFNNTLINKPLVVKHFPAFLEAGRTVMEMRRLYGMYLCIQAALR